MAREVKPATKTDASKMSEYIDACVADLTAITELVARGNAVAPRDYHKLAQAVYRAYHTLADKGQLQDDDDDQG